MALEVLKYFLSNKSPKSWYFPGCPVVKTVLPLQGAHVQSLVREVALWCGQKEKKKNPKSYELKHKFI